MNIVYAQEDFAPTSQSIFLAGPTPRSDNVKSWRPAAIEILEQLSFTGQVFVPECRDGRFHGSYLDQVEWEFKGLETCGVICLWMPRDMATLPGFTSNVEFGRFVGSGKLKYGRPDGAPHTKYLDWLYEKVAGLHPAEDLESLLFTCVKATVE
jgi:hypothetical protein